MSGKKSILNFQGNYTIISHDDHYNFRLALSEFGNEKEYEKLKTTGNKLLFNNTIDELCEDIFYSYYNKKLEVFSEEFVRLRYLFNNTIIKNLIKTETHIEQRKGAYSTIHKHEVSLHIMFLTVKEILTKLDEYMKEKQKDILNELDDKIDKYETSEEDNEDLNEDMLRNELKQYLDKNTDVIEKAVKDGIEKIEKINKESREMLDKFLGGFQQGSEHGKLEKIPIHQRIELAEKLSRTEKLKDIVEYLGRFRIIAQKKQVIKNSNVRIGVSGITRGDDIAKVLASRMTDLAGDDISKTEFMLDWIDKQLPIIDPPPLPKEEDIGKGSVIICVDTSGSMSGEKEYKSKALALAVAEVAFHEERNFACIIFSSEHDNPIIIEIKPNEKIDTTADKVIAIAQSFYGGGTDFELPLKEAISIIEKDEYNNADILFLTDGFANVSDNFLKLYNNVKTEKQFKTIGLLLDASDSERNEGKYILEKFCDDIILNSSIEIDEIFLNSDDMADDIFSSLLL